MSGQEACSHFVAPRSGIGQGFGISAVEWPALVAPEEIEGTVPCAVRLPSVCSALSRTSQGTLG